MEVCACACSYPLSERSGENAKYMRTRPPSWCDRVFMNAPAARLVGLLSDGRHEAPSASSPRRRISRGPPAAMNHTPDRLAPPSPVCSSNLVLSVHSITEYSTIAIQYLLQYFPLTKY